MMDDGWQEKNEKCFVFSCPNIIHILHGVLVGAAGSHFCPKNSHKEESLSHRYKFFLLPLFQTPIGGDDTKLTLNTSTNVKTVCS